MTVAEDFSAFNDACKIPTDKTSSIAYRYQRITRQLNRDFWTFDSPTAHSLYTGLLWPRHRGKGHQRP